MVRVLVRVKGMAGGAGTTETAFHACSLGAMRLVRVGFGFGFGFGFGLGFGLELRA